MTDNFKVVKNKYKILAIISAVALGVFCGVIVACALLLAFKLSAIELLWVYYVLIGIGVAACCTVPFYFLLRPDDKKLAQKLDRQYSLNQKVQTMVEFANAEGTMVTLQREQTNEALAVAAKARPDVKGLLKYVFIPVLAVGIACAGIIVPAKKTTEVLPPFKLTQIQRTAVNNLINDVNSSDFSSGLKVATTAALSDLLGRLENTTLQSEMKRDVVNTIKGIDAIIASTNSYLPLYYSLKDNEYTKPFANATVKGVAHYKDVVTGSINTLDEVKSQIALSGDEIASLLTEWKNGVLDTFYNKDSSGNNTSLLSVSEMALRTSQYSDAFKQGLARCEFTGDGDALITAISTFADDVATISAEWSAEGYLAAIDKKCEAFITLTSLSSTVPVEDALLVQTYSCLMDEFIRNHTAEIFGIKADEIGENTNVVPVISDEEGDEDDNDDETHGGGWGSGDINYGSDDMVLDPDSGEFVQYGTLIARYREKIKERIAEFEALANKEDATAEQKAEAKYVMEELARYVTQYLDRLNKSTEN